MLDKDLCENKHRLNKIEAAAFYLARKQHRVYVWSPDKLSGRFRHTNIKLKTCHPFLMRWAVFFDLYGDKKKKLEKRHNAVFKCNSKKENFDRFVKETVDRMKEKTKESINASV